MKIKHSNSKTIPLLWHEIVERYLVFLRAGAYSERTISTRREHLHFLARRIEFEPQSVTSDVLVAWCGEQLWKQETRRGRNSTFRHFWGWADKKGLLENVATDLPMVRQQTAVPRPTPDQIYVKALEAASPRQELILRLAAEAGLRRSEIAQVHTGRDLVHDLLGISLIVKGKGNKERFVPLTNRLAFMLLDLDEGYAFPGKDNGHLSPVWLGRLGAEALGEGWTLHTLRHRFATRVYDVDKDVFGLQDLLGHASPETTRRYVRRDYAHLRRIVTEASI